MKDPDTHKGYKNKVIDFLVNDPRLYQELIDLLDYQYMKIDFVDKPLDKFEEEYPLDLYCSYTFDQILVALGKHTEKWPLMASLGSMAEKHLITDSNTCLIKLGLFAESMVQLMFTLEEIAEPLKGNTHANRIKVLIRNGLVPKDIADILYDIRISRNDAVHNSYKSTEKAKIILEAAYELGTWFMLTYGNLNYKPVGFAIPEDNSGEIDFKAVIYALEERMNQLAEQIKTSPSNGTDGVIADRKKGATSPVKKNLPAKEAYYGQVSQKQETGEKEIKIGALVRNAINKLVQEDAITEDMVAMLCSKNYCKQAFDIGYPFLKQVEKGISLSEQRKINGYDRYWANEQKIRGHKYFLCNDWYERNRAHFMRWLKIDIYDKKSGSKARLGGSLSKS